MKVLVDTPVWSLGLRRRRKDLSRAERELLFALRDLVVRDEAALVGVVRMELLSGTPDPAAFERLREYLRDFEDEPVLVQDYEEAARCDNLCRAGGVAPSPIDMLLCAVSLRTGAPIFTSDHDFARYARLIPIRTATAAELQASSASSDDNSGGDQEGSSSGGHSTGK